MASETKVDIWMPLYVSDFLTATLGWSAEERGHYLTLLMAQWALGDQGLPSDPKALERISPGLAGCWQMLESKFPAGPDGRLRNARLEEHRADSIEARDKKVRAAHAANEVKRLKAEAAAAAAAASTQAATQSDSQAVTQCVTQCDTQTDTQCGMPSPSPSPIEEFHTHTPGEAADRGKPGRRARAPHGDADGDFRSPGWVHDEWAGIVAVWNVTERAMAWTLATPPSGFADLAASPGWLASARQGMAMLPACRFFDEPLPWTRFVAYLDRILAGEFRTPKAEARRATAAAAKAPRRGNL
jgi:uncharacterized protein YdaU (DUF1376 family)